MLSWYPEEDNTDQGPATDAIYQMSKVALSADGRTGTIKMEEITMWDGGNNEGTLDPETGKMVYPMRFCAVIGGKSSDGYSVTPGYIVDIAEDDFPRWLDS